MRLTKTLRKKNPVVANVPYSGTSYLDELASKLNRAMDHSNYRPVADVAKENWDWSQKTSANTTAKEETSKVVKSRIRVQLSRPLTWAEAEDITTDFADPHFRRLDGNSQVDGLKLWVRANDKEHVWAEAPYGSRPLFDLVAALLANDYVNVFPKAVRTFREYNGE